MAQFFGSITLAVHRAENGEYPDALAQLVPDTIPEIPIDLHLGKPISYQRNEKDGYLLYSVYENGVDDGDNDVGGEVVLDEWTDGNPNHANADLVIRVPLPRINLQLGAKAM